MRSLDHDVTPWLEDILRQVSKDYELQLCFRFASLLFNFIRKCLIMENFGCIINVLIDRIAFGIL